MGRGSFAIVALGFAMASAVPVRAGTLRFPASGPAFVVNEPDGWTDEIDADGKRMTLSAPGGDARLRFVVTPDSSRSMDEEAAVMATTAGADPPTSSAFKTIRGHFGREYDTSMTDPSGGRIGLHIAIVALENGLMGAAMTIIPDSTDAARQAEARAIFDGLMIMSGSP